MDEHRHLGRYLGATFLVVFVGSVLSEALTLSLFSDNTADTLNKIADNTALLRWATVMELCITSVGIVVLAALLYATVKDQNPLLAALAFGCAIAEATILAVSTLGAFLLVPVSEDYAEAGSSSPELIAVADTLRNIDRFGWEVHHVFFGVAGVLWYTLMYQSRRIPGGCPFGASPPSAWPVAAPSCFWPPASICSSWLSLLASLNWCLVSGSSPRDSRQANPTRTWPPMRELDLMGAP